MSPFGVYAIQIGMSDSARLRVAELDASRATAEFTQDLTLPMSEAVTLELPQLPELITPERVIEKMGRGEWESALRMLEIGAGLRK